MLFGVLNLFHMDLIAFPTIFEVFSIKGILKIYLQPYSYAQLFYLCTFLYKFYVASINLLYKFYVQKVKTP